MTLETNSTSDEASVPSGDMGDQIAELLIDRPEEEEVEDVKETPEEEQTEDEETEEPEEEQEEEEVTWSSVLGIEDDKVVLDDDGNFIGLTVKVDGGVSQVPVKDLVAGYQTAKSTTQKSQALSAEKKQFDQHREEAIKVYQARIGEAAKFVDLMQTKLMSDYEGIDWQNLRATNPAEYAATIQDFNARKADIGQISQRIQQETLTLQQEQAQEFEKKRTDFVREHAAKLIEQNPTWADREVAAKAFADMQSFASEYGYNEDEFSNIVDSRALAIIQDAMKYRRGQKVVEKKISKPVPKYQKASGRKTKRKVSKLDALVKRAKTAKGSEKRDLQSDAIAQLLMGE